MEKLESQGVCVPFRKKILIVDDSELTLTMFAKILASDSYQTIQATNGKEALEKAFREPPDLILLDIMMPGMNGFEVTKKLKENVRTHHAPIILVTVLDEKENRLKGLEAGAEEFLTKPIRPQELKARVSSMLTLKQFREQLSIRNHSQQTFSVKLDSEDSDQEPQKDLPLVLLVEDNKGDARLIQHFLKDLPLRLEHVTCAKDAVRLSQSKKVDLILLDIFLPDGDGFEVCRQVKGMEKGKDIPIVIITCLDDIESKIKSIELGTDDFLVKPIIGRELQARTKTLLEKKGQIDKLRCHYEAAFNSDIIDWLTGLYNHGYFKKFLDLEINKSLKQRYPIGLIMIDIDDFKTYNDIHGHSAGDSVLKEVAQVIRKVAREIDLAARFGGDKFAIVLPYVDSLDALSAAQRIDYALEIHNFSQKTSAEEAKLTVSMGIATFPQDAFHAEGLIQRADQKLCEAKQKGIRQISI